MGSQTGNPCQGKCALPHFFPWPSLRPSRISSPVWEHPVPAFTAGRGNSPQQALLGQLMLDEFAFASYYPLYQHKPEELQPLLLFMYLFPWMLIPRKEGAAPFLNYRSLPTPCQHRCLHHAGFRLLCPGASDAGGECISQISRNLVLCRAPITALAACPMCLQGDFALLPSPTLYPRWKRRAPTLAHTQVCQVLKPSPAIPGPIRKFLFAILRDCLALC